MIFEASNAPAFSPVSQVLAANYVSVVQSSEIPILIVVFVVIFSAIVLGLALAQKSEENSRERATVENRDEESTNVDVHSSIMSLVNALESTNWEARREIVSALGNIGGAEVVHPLINVLMTDKNEQVRVTAASWLGRIGDMQAVPPLVEIVDRYLKGTDGASAVAIASASALGDIGSPAGLDAVKRLASSLEQRGKGEEVRKTAHALKDIELTVDMTGRKCIVCNLPLGQKEKLVQCPICRNTAHEAHMLEWLRRSDYCPNCRARISGNDLLSVEPQRLRTKRRKTASNRVKQ